ncbi:response regulator [bacterium]|nr:MAG: response regulator [bacterium]
MLAYSGKGRFVVEKINLSVLVEELLPLMHSVISKKAAINLRLDKELPLVEADVTQMRQVVMNLVTNASDSLMEKSGAITIKTAIAGDGEPGFPGLGGAQKKAGEYIVLTVADDGCGMDEATLSKIFDPFFTTKDKGRGLGLASVTGIIKGHSGKISIESAPEKGTTFRILLPVTQPDSTKELSEIQYVDVGVPEDGAGSKTLLLIDDEPSVRMVGKEMLESAGYKVLAAADGVEGLDIFATHKNEISLVILDMTMPRMDGAETLRRIKAIAPKVPVLLSSGFSEENISGYEGEIRPAGFVKKPYRMKTFLDAISKALYGEAGGA